MSSVRKTYKCLNTAKMIWYVDVNGSVKQVEFISVSKSGNERRGTFTTEDPELIKAMESSPRFNDLFELSDTVDLTPVAKITKTEPKKESEKVIEVVSAEQVKEVNVPEDTKSLLVSNTEVTNVQQAKDYLKSRFPELTFKQLSNKEAVLKVAKEKAIMFEALN